MLGELAPIAWQAGGVFGLVLLAVVVAWWVHIRDCSNFRKEVRDGMSEVKEDVSEVKADVKVIEAVVTRIERNGHGSN